MQNSSSYEKQNWFVCFFNKYGVVITIIASLFYVYGIVCLCNYIVPFSENINTYYFYCVLQNIAELLMIYAIGVKLISFNKWFIGFATEGIVLWIMQVLIDWNAEYLWFIEERALMPSMADFSQFVSDISQFGGLLIVIAFSVGIYHAKKVIEKMVFLFLIIYAITQFVLHYINPFDYDKVIVYSYISYISVIIAIVLFLYSRYKRNRAANE